MRTEQQSNTNVARVICLRMGAVHTDSLQQAIEYFHRRIELTSAPIAQQGLQSLISAVIIPVPPSTSTTGRLPSPTLEAFRFGCENGCAAFRALPITRLT